MGFLYKDPRSPYWHYSVGTGPDRRRGSTGIRHNNAREVPRSGLAFEILLKHEEIRARHKFGHLGIQQASAPVRLAEFKDSFLSWYNARHQDSKAARDRAADSLQMLVTWAEASDVPFLHQFDFAVSEKFITHRLNGGVSANTIRRDCSYYIQAWARAIEMGHAQENHWPKVKPREVEPGRQSRRFTAAEKTILASEIKKLPLPQRYVAMVARYTGARLSSIVLLEKAHVDFDEKLITFPDSITKTKGYTSVLIPQLEAFLQTLNSPKSQEKCWLPAHLIQEHLNRGLFKDRFRAWFDKLRRVYPGQFAGASFHCFRDTFISDGAELGIDERVMRKLAGHSSQRVHQKYTQMDLKRALPALGQL